MLRLARRRVRPSSVTLKGNIEDTDQLGFTNKHGFLTHFHADFIAATLRFGGLVGGLGTWDAKK